MRKIIMSNHIEVKITDTVIDVWMNPKTDGNQNEWSS